MFNKTFKVIPNFLPFLFGQKIKLIGFKQMFDFLGEAFNQCLDFISKALTEENPRSPMYN